MSNNMAMHAVVTGRVQGVYFRAFVQEKARELGLTGYVRNLPSGREVEVQAEGDKTALEKLAGHLNSGPPGAMVQGVKITWSKPEDKYTEFSVSG
jgi:acylphosphatase